MPMSDLGSLLPALSFGIAIGLLVYVLILRSHQKQTATSLHAQTALLNTWREERDQAIQHAIRLEAELDSERKQVQHRIESLNEAKEALSNQFKNLANEILEDKTKRFTEQNHTNLQQLLEPWRLRINEFQGKVEEVSRIRCDTV